MIAHLSDAPAGTHDERLARSPFALITRSRPAAPTADREPAPPGSLFDVGGHRLHAIVRGSGVPTVIFEGGGASRSLDWHLVQSAVAERTRTLSYDRAGLAWSERGPSPRDAERLTTELSALLHCAQIEPPYLLVGASFGGHIARLFAARHPGEVSGVVLVDARHEAVDLRMPPGWMAQQRLARRMFQTMQVASRLGLLPVLARVGGASALPPMASRLPPELRKLYLRSGFTPRSLAADLAEFDAVGLSDPQVAFAGHLGDIPLIVIRHGRPDLFAKMGHQADEAERVWQELQDDLARLSSRSEIRVAEHSGHAVQVEQPEVVVDAIGALLSDRAA